MMKVGMILQLSPAHNLYGYVTFANKRSYYILWEDEVKPFGYNQVIDTSYQIITDIFCENV